MAAVLLQPQRLQNSSYLMLKLITFVSYPASQFRCWISSSHQANQKCCAASHTHTGSFQRRKYTPGCSENSKAAHTHTHAHTRSSLSHECAADRGLSPLTPKLVVTICAKVSPCCLFATTTNSGLVSVYLRSGSRLAPCDVLTREGDLRGPCHHGSRIFNSFFFFLNPDLTTHMVCRSAPKRYPAARDTFTGTK